MLKLKNGKCKEKKKKANLQIESEHSLIEKVLLYLL